MYKNLGIWERKNLLRRLKGIRYLKTISSNKFKEYSEIQSLNEELDNMTDIRLADIKLTDEHWDIIKELAGCWDLLTKEDLTYVRHVYYLHEMAKRNKGFEYLWINLGFVLNPSEFETESFKGIYMDVYTDDVLRRTEGIAAEQYYGKDFETCSRMLGDYFQPLLEYVNSEDYDESNCVAIYRIELRPTDEVLKKYTKEKFIEKMDSLIYDLNESMEDYYGSVCLVNLNTDDFTIAIAVDSFGYFDSYRFIENYLCICALNQGLLEI